jgi:hypothetical protein
VLALSRLSADLSGELLQQTSSKLAHRIDQRVGGAQFLGREAELGTIAVGKRADLYLVDGDPLKNIGDIRRGRLVVKDGAFYFPDEMQEVLGITPFARRAEIRNAGLERPARH